MRHERKLWTTVLRGTFLQIVSYANSSLASKDGTNEPSWNCSTMKVVLLTSCFHIENLKHCPRVEDSIGSMQDVLLATRFLTSNSSNTSIVHLIFAMLLFCKMGLSIVPEAWKTFIL